MIQSDLLPDTATMWRAFEKRDAEFEGIFLVGVRTTGIFCRPTCSARKPKAENVEFFPRAGDALAAGYRPCKRCTPMEAKGSFPDWLKPLMAAVDSEPLRRWTAEDLRGSGIDPARARRWFQASYGMTFLAYLRARRLGQAFSRIQEGADVIEASMGSRLRFRQRILRCDQTQNWALSDERKGEERPECRAGGISFGPNHGGW